ncbi:UDP-glucose dehydrogenase family protein [Sphingosinicella microcystinivorans]|uniref:UDP-glucose dehydrogenase family protein n=1 Tax=Sphingosinicella microcystinivorans TaxID=335406 RepID=UPI0022F38D14|nr:UDP-glucose/GDP-mannose dehydrogenase family protein [Sphingosinicella microcystinivorans]WBX84783.1 UDP-glucose/GDP-mannose dehydrogenase family protein [Sphingosinicella microcystinivorans]
MRIAMIGTGYVGLVSGACFSEFGHSVTCVDLNAAVIERLKAGEIPIFEPGLDDLVARNVKAGRLTFTTDLAAGVKDADAVFIAVGTPSRRGDGHADLSYVYAAARQIAEAAPETCVIVNKSTVPVGTATEVERIAREAAPEKAISVASNPEFLREGSAIEDFMRPDRVVCGVADDHAREVLKAIYRPLSLREVPILFADRPTAEVIKYAANAFLAVKISFINEIADLCEKVGADVQGVAKGIGLDKRIGPKFLHPGPGYGGSCFPKDTLALLKTAEDNDVALQIVAATVKVNDERKRAMADRIIAACGGSVDGKTIGILGLTFKPNTDDMREAPSLVIIPALQAAGAKVKAFDPEGMRAAAALLPGVEMCGDAYAALDGADAAVLLTEWNEFRALDLGRVRDGLKAPVFVDLRNVYPVEEPLRRGLSYASIGR